MEQLRAAAVQELLVLTAFPPQMVAQVDLESHLLLRGLL